MGKKLVSIMMAAGLFAACLPCSMFAEDEVMIPDTEEGQEASGSDDTASQEFISSDALFEVVSEVQSSEGTTLEEAIPQPQTAPVPAVPPSDSLTVRTLDPHPGPAYAMLRCLEEYENADLHGYSDKIFWTCTRKETRNGFYYLTHVVVKDSSQIGGEDSFGDFAGERETPQDAALRTGAEVLTNGSYFSYETAHATGGELLIRNGKVLHGEYSDGYEICLRKDGTLFSPGYNTVSSVLDQDVVFSWGTCEDLLICDGKKCTLTDYDWNGYFYPRTAIGMVRPLEYYIITAGGADYTGGLTVNEEQKIFYDLGCTYARGLDGGASSALVIEGEYVNENGDRLEDGTLQRRAVADFILFLSE